MTRAIIERRAAAERRRRLRRLLSAARRCAAQLEPRLAAHRRAAAADRPTTYRVDEVEADPIRLNAQLGHYTNFVNLLDLCGVAVPAGFQPDGLPFGVTLIGAGLSRAGAARRSPSVCTRRRRADGRDARTAARRAATGRGARRVASSWWSAAPTCAACRSTTSSPSAARAGRGDAHRGEYRLFALPDGRARPRAGRSTAPRSKSRCGRIPVAQLGSFVAAIPPPLAIGTVRLADGRQAKGFLCESIAARGADDITAHGGWRAYLAAKAK